MEKKALSPPSEIIGVDILAQSSRKRKLTCSPSRNSETSGVLQQCLIPYGFVNLNGIACYREACKYRFSCDVENCNSSSPGLNIISTVGIPSFGASEKEKKQNAAITLENGVEISCGPLSIGLEDSCKEKYEGHGDGNTPISKKVERSDLENSKNALVVETLPKNGDSSANMVVGHGQGNNKCHGSIKLDGKSKLPAAILSSPDAEKLWDGSLQLSSSVTVSAVAFFKSGEKIPDVKWSEFVEVKGKVRLEAFEKYIQDLPRSRNRGLMVISLCWKAGSSETGLKGMKEVAKGYKEGERVGFAQLSPGIDLYICPRSNTIITILAKYGFFKGMKAIEDNSDSLIGCVVWRRNRTTSSSVRKNSEIKNHSISERSPSTPSDSSTRTIADKKVSHTQAALEFISVASVTDCRTTESAGHSGNESKNCGKVQLGMCNSLPRPAVPCNSLSSAIGVQTSSCSVDVSVQVPIRYSASLVHSSGPEKPKATVELQKTAFFLPSDGIKELLPTLDNDDLPEFDFGTSCGSTQTPKIKPFDAVKVDKKLMVEGLRKNDGPLLPINRAVQPPHPTQRTEKTNLPRFPPDGWHDQIPVLPIHNRTYMTPVETRAGPMPKNLFDDDDDDMPEWCPPDAFRKPSVPQIRRPSTSVPYEILSPGPSHPLLPSPYPATQYSHSTQPSFPHAYNYPITTPGKPTQATKGDGFVQEGSSSSMGLTRLPLNPFDVKLSIHPADRRGWKQ